MEAKIDWKEIYNVRDPLRMGDRKKAKEKRKEEDSSNLQDLGNLFNLVPKEKKEH